MSELSFIARGKESSRAAHDDANGVATARRGRSRAATGLDRARQRRSAMQVRAVTHAMRRARGRCRREFQMQSLDDGDARRANASEGGAEDARAIAIDRDER